MNELIHTRRAADFVDVEIVTLDWALWWKRAGLN